MNNPIIEKAAPSGTSTEDSKNAEIYSPLECHPYFNTLVDRLQATKIDLSNFEKISEVLPDIIPDEELPQFCEMTLDMFKWTTVEDDELTEMIAGSNVWSVLRTPRYIVENLIREDGILVVRTELGNGKLSTARLGHPARASVGFLEWLKEKYEPSYEMEFGDDYTYVDTGEYRGEVATRLKAICTDLIRAGCNPSADDVITPVLALCAAQHGIIRDYQLDAIVLGYRMYKAELGMKGDYYWESMYLGNTHLSHNY